MARVMPVAQPQALAHHLAPQVEVAVLAAAPPRSRVSSSWKGSGSERLSTSSARATSSTAPDSRCGLTVPAGRARTVPLTRTTNSLRSRSASVNTGREFGVEHHLQQALAVAQVDENHPAVVAAAMDPAGDADLLAE